MYAHSPRGQEESVNLVQNKVRGMFTVPRNRRPIQASEIVMFMQQVKTSSTVPNSCG